jgi:imidazolonepropionase-like amidohydrolase
MDGVPSELLKMWTENTPKTIIPNRKIGKLENSFEANFMALADNLLENRNAVNTIKYRFKQGVPIK